MRYLFLILFFFLFQQSYTQQQYNLVPNWSFEDSVVCPSNALLNPIPKPWYFPNKKVDYCQWGLYCNRCSNVNWASVPYNYDSSIYPTSSYQETKTGDAYAMFYTYNNGFSDRAYLQVFLKKTLQAGKKYWCIYWVSSVNISKYVSNNLGMLFTNTAVYADTITNACNGLLLANPQILNYGNPIINDTLNWVSISGVYTAVGGEEYITLGNFKPDSLTNSDLVLYNSNSSLVVAEYYVDDVSVIPLDSFNLKADAGKDTTIHIGDSVFIGTYTNGIDTIKWQILNTNTTIDSLRPGFWVKPTTDICYTITQTVNGFTSSDTVCVYVLPLPLKFTNYEVRFTNENGGSIPPLGGVRGGFIQNLWITASEINVSHFNIQRSINGKDFTTIGNVAAQNKITNEYYFTDELIPKDQNLKTIYYRIESVDKDGRKQYSTTQQINIKHQTPNIVLFPNPVKDNVTIECKGAKELMIIDYLGRVITYKKIINNQLTIINVKEFSKGVYVVKAIMKNGEIKTEKLVVQ